jgi:hypothetical protein
MAHLFGGAHSNGEQNGTYGSIARSLAAMRGGHHGGGGLDVEQEEKRRWLGVVDVIGWSVSGKPQRDALLRNNGISLCSRPA